MEKNSARLLYGVLNRPSTQVLKLLRGPTAQAALATALDLNINSVSDWETGRTTPAPGNLFDLLAHYMKWTGKLGWPALDLLLIAAADSEEPSTITPVRYELTP
jgi:transcriptional regulator with XRE-family HTH domain